MANNRLLLLSTVTLVAITVQIGAWDHIPSAEDQLRLEKLGKDLLPRKEVKIILESIEAKDQIKIGFLSVSYILHLEGATMLDMNNGPTESCEYIEIANRVASLLVDNSNLFINVFQFLHPKSMLCPQNIVKMYRVLWRLRPLFTKDDLSKEEVGRLLLAIEDKEDVLLGDKKLQTVLDQIDTARKLDFSVDDCEDVAPKYLGGPDIFVANMKKFDESRYRLVSFCAHYGNLVSSRLTSSLTDEDKRCFGEFAHLYELSKLFNIYNLGDNATSRQLNERCSRLVPKLRNARYIFEENLKRGVLVPSIAHVVNSAEWTTVYLMCNWCRDYYSTDQY